MSRCCHECGGNLENPFYEISAYVKTEDGKAAQSDMSCSLCSSDFRKIKLTPEMPEGIGFVIDGVTGSRGGFTGNVQLSGAYERHGQYMFLSLEDAKIHLPKSAKDLLKDPNWVAQDEMGTWKKADWVK